MARKNRVIFEGAIYHIYQRGNNKEYIFQDDKIKSFILKYLKEYNKKFDYEVLAYVIMNNHYHLLIKTNKSPIDQIMFYLNNLLGKYINDKLNRTGHAFEDRYKCELVETDTYLIWLLRYIHRNPVKANICNDVKDYRWSSHSFYQYYIASLFINTSFILSMLGNDKDSATKVYLKLVESTGFQENVDKDCEIIKEMINFSETRAVNENNFINNFAGSNRKTLDEIITELNINRNMVIDIRNGMRTPSLTPVKLKIIGRAIEECYSLREIADYLNVVPSAISKLLSRNVK